VLDLDAFRRALYPVPAGLGEAEFHAPHLTGVDLPAAVERGREAFLIELERVLHAAGIVMLRGISTTECTIGSSAGWSVTSRSDGRCRSCDVPVPAGEKTCSASTLLAVAKMVVEDWRVVLGVGEGKTDPEDPRTVAAEVAAFHGWDRAYSVAYALLLILRDLPAEACVERPYARDHFFDNQRRCAAALQALGGRSEPGHGHG
jgi:hypothetical protein